MTGFSSLILRSLLVLLTLLPAVGFAQADQLKIDVAAGLGGYHRAGRWVPITATITNQPAAGESLDSIEDFEGQLLVITAPLEGVPAQRYLREIDVPRASTKRQTLYAKFPDRGNVPAPPLFVNSTAGRVLRQVMLPLTGLAKDQVLIANISKSISRPNLPRLREQIENPVFAHVAPEELPDYWAAWDSADIVVMSGWPEKGISGEQARALHEWVLMGGTLVMLTGAETQTYTGEEAQELLPVELLKTGLLVEESNGRFRVTPALNPDEKPRANYVISLGRPKPGTETLLSRDGFPLVARQALGQGQIVYFAGDLQSQSVTLEQFLTPAWFGATPLRNYAAAEWELAPRLLSQIKTVTGTAARPPNVAILALLCIVYTLTVGPINFYLLSRMKKMEWAWITLPAIVVVFFVLIYGVGRLLKGDSQIVREMALEQYQQGQEEGAGTTITSTFVSTAGRHFLRPTGNGHAIERVFRWHENDPWRTDRYFGMGGLSGSSANLGGDTAITAFDTLVGDGGISRSNLMIRAWEMGTYDAQIFVSRGAVSLEGRIDADLVWTGRSLTGTIRNATDRDFSNAYLHLGTQYLSIGTLAAGASFTLNPSDELRGVAPNPGNSQAFPQVSRWLPAEGFITQLADESEEKIDQYNASVLMHAMMSPDNTGLLFPPESGRLRFIGLGESTTKRTFTSITPDTESRIVITTAELKPRVSLGQPAQVPPRLVRVGVPYYTLGQVGEFTISDGRSLLLVNSAGVIATELPFQDPSLEVTQFRLDVPSTGPPESTFTVSVYLHGPRGAWQTVPLGQALANPGAALDGNGRMLIRVEDRPPAQGMNMSFNSSERGTTVQDIQVTYTVAQRPEEKAGNE